MAKVQLDVADSSNAALCADLGVDLVAVAADATRTFAEARATLGAVGDRCGTVAISVVDDPKAIARMVRAVEPQVVQLSGASLPPPTVAELRRALAPVKVMQPVAGVALARSYERSADWLLLEGNHGANDWTLSAEIARAVRVPVLLGGLLGPGQVAEAVRAVHPWGVAPSRVADAAEIAQLVRAAAEAHSRPGIDYPAVTCAFVCHDGHGRVLLHQRGGGARDEPATWDSGAGQLELGETLEQAVRREIREEYGVAAEEVRFVDARTTLRERDGVRHHWVALTFVARVDPEQVAIGEPGKIQEIGWFHPDHLPEPLHSQFSETFRRGLAALGWG